MKKLLSATILLFLTSILFANSANKYDITVAKDGSGDFTTVQEAINSVRAEMQSRKTILIKKGVYKEKVVVPTTCMNVTLIGEDRDSTVITWDDHANLLMPGTDKKMGTFRTYTILVQGNGFCAENLTIENNAPMLGQAVALHVEGDKVKFVNCRFLGNQDTIYAGRENSRQYFENCYIEGTTDFIFGPSTAYFEGCVINSKKNSYITAPSTPEYRKYGFIFHKCKLTAEKGIDKVFLGRPWRPYGESVYIECEMDRHIRPEGWDNWRNPENEKTARFVEISNTGDGAALDKRVGWCKKGKKKDMKDYSISKVFGASDGIWNPKSN